ncbi:glutamate racemase [Brucella anthropi]|uniref:glutamate racemase n=1 Tax=Brucella anthropi TaxID=529 RepID=UPI00124E400F|nr:aspartate/glutamate racemase family protein [Brucella anthropi]KAB2750189.1 Asp/Glu racemase [Brucella anthropi]MDH0365524.1 aspartate/glutamate racemase family protein [Brucella anthropi]
MLKNKTVAAVGDLNDPVAVFDAGIGSYALVELIRRSQPQRDIIYFADRASFPYGAKSRDQLLSIMRSTIQYLTSLGAQTIVLASNAPSVMVLDTLKSKFAVPVYGVAPPVRTALATSHSGKVAVMGVRSMIESEELADFVRTQADNPGDVALINASAMVELVENGAFLRQPDETAQKVAAFCDDIAASHPHIDTLTLSSTHLPWLRPFFETARPGWQFLDPADDVIAALPQPEGGSGRTVALVTESETYPVAEFRHMLEILQVDLPLTVIDPVFDKPV